VIVTFAYIAVAAIWEEFIFRATMLKNLAEGGAGYVDPKAAVLLAVRLSTLVFATLHGEKVTHVSQYRYYVIADLVLGSVYVLSGDTRRNKQHSGACCGGGGETLGTPL
jgi:membrane protease YdiL (CAAX protease family)